MNGVERSRKAAKTSQGQVAAKSRKVESGKDAEKMETAEERAERLQRKLVKYFAVDEEKIHLDPQQTDADPAKWAAARREMAENSRAEILASFDVEVDGRLREKVLDDIALGRIGEREIRECLMKIKGPLETEGAEAIFAKIDEDAKQKQILVVTTGGRMKDWAKANVEMVQNALTRVVGGWDLRTPAGFAEFKRKFLRGIAEKASEEQRQAYTESMKEFEEALYGRKLEYYRQYLALTREANAEFEQAGTKERPKRPEQRARSGRGFVSMPEKLGKHEYEAKRNSLLQKAVIYGDPWEVNGREYRLSAQQLDKAGLAPVYEAEIDGRKIYLSEIFQLDSGRPAVIGYVATDTDEILVNSYYRGLTSGVWRMLPDFVRHPNAMKIDWYGEGYGRESLVVPIEMQQVLAQIENQYGRKQISAANTDFLFAGMTRSYSSKQEYMEKLAQGQMSGNYYDEVAPQSYNHDFPLMAEQKRPPYTQSVNVQIAPDFAKVVAEYRTTTHFAGPTFVQAFVSRNGEYKYAFDRDPRGRVWVSQIEKLTAPVTAAGLRADWLAACDLTTALYELSGTAGIYGDPTDTRGSYQCMWKNYLSRVPLIEDYAKNRMVEEK